MKNINTRLKMALLLHSKESGFAIVIAVSLGLIMILVGLTMTLRSQGDQVISSTQKQTDEALAAAEKGIAFYREFFNSSSLNRKLVEFPDCADRADINNPGSVCNDPGTTTDVTKMSWSNLATNTANVGSIRSICDTSSLNGIANVYAATDWKDANDPLDTDTNVESSQEFRLVEYKSTRIGTTQNIIKRIGTLTVEGRITPDNNENINKSISRLEVTFPIRDGDIFGLPVPGVWVGGSSDTNGTGQNNIEGDVLVNNCNISDSDFALMQDNIQGDHEVRTTEMQLPSIPTQPSTRVIGTPANNPPAPVRGIPNANGDRPGAIPLGSITSDISLPRTQNGSGNPPAYYSDERFKMSSWAGVDEDVYVYTVSSIGNNSPLTVKIRPNTKVMLYLEGSITRNVSIICGEDTASQTTNGNGNGNRNNNNNNNQPGSTGCADHNPMNLMIFGTATTGNPQICINGNREIQAFILAPEYTVGINGGGSVAGNYKGAVWAKEWGEGQGCSSRATGNGVLAVRQEGTWDDVPATVRGQISVQYPPEIDAAGTWTRQEVE